MRIFPKINSSSGDFAFKFLRASRLRLHPFLLSRLPPPWPRPGSASGHAPSPRPRPRSVLTRAVGSLPVSPAGVRTGSERGLMWAPDAEGRMTRCQHHACGRDAEPRARSGGWVRSQARGAGAAEGRLPFLPGPGRLLRPRPTRPARACLEGPALSLASQLHVCCLRGSVDERTWEGLVHQVKRVSNEIARGIFGLLIYIF